MRTSIALTLIAAASLGLSACSGGDETANTATTNDTAVNSFDPALDANLADNASALSDNASGNETGDNTTNSL